MMGRLNHDQEQFFYSFRLDEAMPQDHPVREVAAVLDLSWVHSELAPYYPRLGRPSIDPVLMIRMLIVGYVFGIRSPLQAFLVSDSVAVRRFATGARRIRPLMRAQRHHRGLSPPKETSDTPDSRPPHDRAPAPSGCQKHSRR